MRVFRPLAALAVLALLLFGSPALCEEGGAEPIRCEWPTVGMTVSFPREFGGELSGSILLDYGEAVPNSGVFYAAVSYCPMPEERLRALLAGMSRGTNTPEETQLLLGAPRGLFTIYGASGGRPFEAVRDFCRKWMGTDPDASRARRIGEAEDYVFYGCEGPDPADMDEPFAGEFALLKSRAGWIFDHAEFSRPAGEYEGILGRTFRFETADLAGNPVRSEELFGRHAVTLVNVWASWCPPCVRELPGLGEMHRRFGASDCGVVGLLYDSDSAEAVSKAAALLEQSGADYPVLRRPGSLSDILELRAFPTTFFVDRSGAVVGAPIVGADLDAYEKTMAFLRDQTE